MLLLLRYKRPLGLFFCDDISPKKNISINWTRLNNLLYNSVYKILEVKIMNNLDTGNYYGNIENNYGYIENYCGNIKNNYGYINYRDCQKSKININTISLEELKEIPGIGALSVKRIKNYREKNKIIEIEELREIDGIGAGKIQAIKNYILLTSYTTT